MFAQHSSPRCGKGTQRRSLFDVWVEMLLADGRAKWKNGHGCPEKVKIVSTDATEKVLFLGTIKEALDPNRLKSSI
jgi:hypothetical protein